MGKRIEDIEGIGPSIGAALRDAGVDSVDTLLERANLSRDDIDLYVFHQASKVVLDRLQETLGVEDQRFFRNYADMGNTVSATIPMALKDAQDEGRIKPGMTLLLMGFGVGYSLAGCIMRT